MMRPPALPGQPDGGRPSRGVVPVVQVFSCLEIGGTELRAMELIPPLAGAGIDLHLVTMAGRPGAVAPRMRSLGAQVHCSRWSPLFPFRFLRLLYRLRPRAVHTHVDLNAGPIMLLAAIARVPVRVAQCHSDGEYGSTFRRRLQWTASRALTRAYATDLIGVSPVATQAIHSQSWQSDPRCRVVPDGIGLQRLCQEDSAADLRAAVGADANDVLVLHIGRPNPVKRRWMIPPMVAALRGKGLSARVVFVGPHDPVDDESVRRAALIYKVDERIHMWGATEDVGSLLRQADVLAHPSANEGLSGVVLEAVAVGTPVVASDLPGIRFIAEHLGGIVFVERDAAAPAWAEAISEAAARKVTLEEREDAMRRFRQSIFSLETIAAQHLAIYRRGDRSDAVREGDVAGNHLI